MKLKRRIGAVLGVILVLMIASAGMASTVLDETAFVTGEERFAFEFEIVDGGQYQTTLTELEFPASLDTLLLFVSTGMDVVGTPLVGPGMFTFDADPGMFVANILGWAGGDFRLGAFNVEVAVAQAPVPPAMMLLASGLIGLFSMRRFRNNLS